MATKNITLKKLGKRFVATILAVAMIVSTITIQSTNNIVGAEETAKSTDGYVIENTSNKTINVVIKHMLNDNEIYSADNKELAGYGKVNNYKKAVNYNVESVEVDNKILSDSNQWSKIEVSNNTTVQVNYKPISKVNEGNSVAFYDYDVVPKDNKLKGSINYYKNYDQNDDRGHFTIGQEGQNYAEKWTNWGGWQQAWFDKTGQTDYKASEHSNIDSAKNSAGQYINRYAGLQSTSHNNLTNTVSGIINGLDENWNVEFNFNEPGVFTDEEKAGKTVYNNGEYTLNFDQNGDTYTLASVKNTNTKDIVAQTVAGGGKEHNFLPMPASKSKEDTSTAEGSNGANFFFGMRYDVEFKLGDYVGDLNYKFAGDDDMWVLLDGKVVLDLGGIHSKATGEIDLWNVLGSDPDRTATHRLTVLYMERGAWQSNCEMKFTLPNARVVNVSSTPKADIIIDKVSSEGNTPLKGAQFTLTNDSNSNDTVTDYTDSNGQIKFTNLVEGTYTLTEVSAPDGYQITESTYKVKVTNNSDGKTATARLYKADGKNEITNKTIVNIPNKELIEDILDYEKTAKLSSDENAWENREYQITIKASSNKSDIDVTKSASDIMLVLDRSGSMAKNNNSINLISLGKYSDVKNSLSVGDSKNYRVYYNEIICEISYSYSKKVWEYRYKSKWYTITNDQIIYRRETYMDELKLAAGVFLDNIASTAPNNMVGVASFSSADSNGTNYGSGTHDVEIQKIGSDASNYKDKINSLTAKGGTSPELGLAFAISDLKKLRDNGSENRQYVILFTDGEPTGNSTNGTWNSKAASEEAIQKLKDAGVVVYTIGFNLTNGSKASNWLKNTIASDAAHAKTADNIDDLNEVFKEIENEVVSGASISGVKIVDTIDSRFTITEEEEQRLIGSGATVTYNNNGTITVKWDNQEIPYSDNGKYEWSKTINVVAKDEFIGGNDVSTNVPGEDNSYIEIPELGKAELQEPKVNVKLDFVVNNVNEVLFKGETFTNSEEMIKKLFDSSAVTNSKGTEITMYDRDSFSTQLYKADANGEKTAETVDVGEQFTINDARYLDVTYNPGVASNSATVNTNGHTAQENNANVKTGKLDVKFVAGRLAITKKIDSKYTSISQINSNQSFIFKIDQYKVNDDGTQYLENGAPVLVRTFYETISFDANKDEKEKTAYISELEKGYYVITEESSWSTKYTLTNIEVNGTKVDGSNGSNVVVIGTIDDTKTDDKKYYNGLDKNCYSDIANGDHGLIGFINSIKDWNKWYSDTGFAKNIFKKD